MDIFPNSSGYCPFTDDVIVAYVVQPIPTGIYSIAKKGTLNAKTRYNIKEMQEREKNLRLGYYLAQGNT